MHDVIVIGGGAAGMMAAYAAAQNGASVLLLERNEKLGKKVYITGKGRCNVTNDCTLDEFMAEVPRNPRFMYSALDAFSPQDMMQLLEDNGCPVVVQRGRRVFPATEKASDVTRTFERILRKYDVTVRFHARVKSLLVANDAVQGVIMEDGRQESARTVIIATGGRTYSVTGSTGDGYDLAKSVGHTVTPQKGVLSALVTKDKWPCTLQGLALKNVSMTLKKGKKTLYTQLGEMLFTHFGISGPLVLEMSCHMPDDFADAQVLLNLKPGLTEEQLDARLQRDLAANHRKQLISILPGLMPAALASIFPSLCDVDGRKTCDGITREERQRIVYSMQHLPLPIERFAPMEEAIVTRGGIAVKEIVPSTMMSKLVQGLFFAGEVIDVDAHTGGYNLQIAFSTGYAAGKAAAEYR